jgi:hypothetical protein
MTNTQLIGTVIAATGSVVSFALSRWHYRKGNDFLAVNFMIPTVLLGGITFLFIAVN